MNEIRTFDFFENIHDLIQNFMSMITCSNREKYHLCRFMRIEVIWT